MEPSPSWEYTRDSQASRFPSPVLALAFPSKVAPLAQPREAPIPAPLDSSKPAPSIIPVKFAATSHAPTLIPDVSPTPAFTYVPPSAPPPRHSIPKGHIKRMTVGDLSLSTTQTVEPYTLGSVGLSP